MTPRQINTDFRCLHCRNYVTTMQAICRVNNRNHCPYCLWSRHLDLYNAGDRLSACKAPMRPLGLAMKPGRNKYAPGGGELMLVHLCMECGRLSLNRIAADDDPQALLEIFDAACSQPPEHFDLLLGRGIHLLDSSSNQLVRAQLL